MIDNPYPDIKRTSAQFIRLIFIVNESHNLVTFVEIGNGQRSSIKFKFRGEFLIKLTIKRYCIIKYTILH